MSVETTLKDYIIGLQHIGHVVTDLDAAIRGFANLYGIETDDIRRVPEAPDSDTPTLFAFVSVGDTEFELIQPVSEQSKADLLAVASGGAGINHVAWRVTDIQACVQHLSERSINPGHVTPDGIVSFANKKLVYLNPDDCGGLLVELIEISDDV